MVDVHQSTFENVNPATEKVMESYDGHTSSDVEDALTQAEKTSREWRETPMTRRQELLKDAARVLRNQKERYAEIMTREMGKPIRDAEAEVEKCAWVCDYYAERASEHLADEEVGTDTHAETYVRYEPLGPVLAVMPWNFPFWQVFRFAAPNLAAGNVGILKHASNVPGCAVAIEEVFSEAGFPDGAFTTLLVGSSDVDELIRDGRVKAVTLTGSEHAGRSVAETAGARLKKTVLELGGSDPFIVLEDADVTAAAETGAQARNINSGQSCIAAKRFVVHEAVYDDFLERLVTETESLQVGDPMDPDTDVGPQAREDLMETLHRQVRESVEAGAELLSGGEPLDRDGYYYPPTVLAGVPEGCPAAGEEVFGPVAAVFLVEGEEEAIRKANDTRYGLGGSVWTEDLARGRRVAHELDVGCAFVNELVKSDPRLPFGGVKASGYGRELGRDGIREFVNRKTVWVDHR